MKAHEQNERPAPLILVVDDIEEARDAMGCWLEHEGYRVAKAENGFDGMRKAASLHPDLILMDLNMPGMDGIETTRFLKRHRSTSDIPIVAVTGQAILGDEHRARRRGFEAVLTKPVDTDALSGQLENILHG
jgi:CheY-like chemotaxis protein